MLNKTVLFITILSYAVIVSQPFMYMLSLKNTQLSLGGGSYTEIRQLIDANMRGLFKYVIYAAVLSNLLYMILVARNFTGIQFITAGIALLALIFDVVLTLKGSLPLNDIINSWAPENYPANWKEIRDKWFTIFQYRQIATVIGFISLVVGAVFGKL